MIIWFALLIPLIGCILAYTTWKYKFVWWELALPTISSFFFILITKFSVETALTSDTQYMGGLITEARYYEYWSTWVHKTCSYDCNCEKDKDGHEHCQTCYRDCSYCDENRAYWMAYDNQGHSWEISEDEYLKLKRQWNATPEKVELNRSIRKHGSCGDDGDMYRIYWDRNILTSESSTWTGSYTNKVQVSKSNFDLKNISNKDAKKLGLYKYPKLDVYSQPNILGLDSITFLSPYQKKLTEIKYKYFNGYYGPIRKIRLYVLLFVDKPVSLVDKQKSYWDGGNKNEMVLCIDVKKNTGEINWVSSFSWTENKRIAVDLREDIWNTKYLNFDSTYNIIETATKDFTYRDFQQFNYLTVDPPKWEIWFVYLMTLGITIGILIYGYQNEFENEIEVDNETDDEPRITLKEWFKLNWNRLKMKIQKLKQGQL
jgi:hypothetical protein